MAVAMLCTRADRGRQLPQPGYKRRIVLSAPQSLWPPGSEKLLAVSKAAAYQPAYGVWRSVGRAERWAASRLRITSAGGNEQLVATQKPARGAQARF